MVRIAIIGIVGAVAFTLYALVDAAMSDAARARGVSKPAWVVLIVLLPVIGAVLWFTIGKTRGEVPATVAPDDDPRFTGTRLSESELDEHMRDLEARLRELDDETFPGEKRPGGAAQAESRSADSVTSAADPGERPVDPGGSAAEQAGAVERGNSAAEHDSAAEHGNSAAERGDSASEHGGAAADAGGTAADPDAATSEAAEDDVPPNHS